MTPRVDVQLSQHLIEKGLLSQDLLEEAMQKQMVLGGALDTILLETGELDEARLSAALAAAWQTAPLSVDRVANPDIRAAEKIPERIAARIDVCPLFVDEQGLHVATRGPLDRQLIGELSALLQRTIIAHVVPEVRLSQAIAAAYEGVPDERMAALLTRLELQRTGIAPSFRARPEEAPALEDIPSDGETFVTEDWDLVEALAHLVAQETRAGISEVVINYARRFLPFAAVFGIKGRTAMGWDRAGPCEGALFEQSFEVPGDSILGGLIDNPSPFLGRPPGGTDNAVLFGWLGRRRPWTVLLIPIVVAGRAVGALYGDGGVRSRDYESLSDLVAFGARIGPAFEALLRARHRQTAGATDTGDDDNERRDGTSPFARNYVAPTPIKGPAPKQKERRPQWSADEVRTIRPDEMPSSLTAPPQPASLFDEHSGDDLIETDGPASVEEALASAAAVAVAEIDAFVTDEHGAVDAGFDIFADDQGELLVPAPDGVMAKEPSDKIEAVVPRLPTTLTDEPLDADPLPELLREDGWEDIDVLDLYISAPEVHVERSPLLSARPVAPISPSEWIERLYSKKTETSARAIDALVAFGDGALPALNANFPGRLRIDPFSGAEEPIAALQLGPLVEVLARMGDGGLKLAKEHLDSRSRVKRYVAVFLHLFATDDACIPGVRPRLHDTEPCIQSLATKVLARFVTSTRFEPEVLAHLRARLDSPVYDARERAIRLLGQFKDPRAVAPLIQLVEGDMGREAIRALRHITLCDFGSKTRTWSKWWNKAKHRPRIEWLIDGLKSKSERCRAAALGELLALTGDNFGYIVDDKKSARDKSAARFEAWWHDRRQSLGA